MTTLKEFADLKEGRLLCAFVETEWIRAPEHHQDSPIPSKGSEEEMEEPEE